MSKQVYTATIKAGSAPTYELHTLAEPKEDEVQVKVLAAGISHLAKHRASGAHYSVAASDEAQPFGVDGVGLLNDELVFFATMEPGNGAYAEYVNVKKSFVVPFPKDLKDKQKAIANVAGLFNSTLGPIFALRRIPGGIKEGSTIMIIGATGSAGVVSAQLAKRVFGASKVIGVSRNKDSLEELKKDGIIDEYFETTPGSDADFSKLGDVDVVLDYVAGDVAETFLELVAKHKKQPWVPVYWIAIGNIGGQAKIALSNPALRSRNLFILGSGLGQHSPQMMTEALQQIVDILTAGKIDVPVDAVPLKDIATAWSLPPMVDGKRRYFVV